MAPRSATEEMAALAVETSDATATEAEAAPQAPQGRSRALKVAGAAGAAALAAGAVAAVVSGRAAPLSSLLQQARGGGVTALQSDKLQVGVGCTNWDMILLREASLCKADECWELCAQSPGCKAMNFQGYSNELCGVGGGKEEGTCYLYSEACEEVDNACWTLGVMPATGGLGSTDTAGVTGGLSGTDTAGVTGGPSGTDTAGVTGGLSGTDTAGVTGGLSGTDTAGATGGLGGTDTAGVTGGLSGTDTAGVTGGLGSTDTAGDKVAAVNFKLAGLNFASSNSDPDAMDAVESAVKEALAKYAQVRPDEVAVAFSEASDGSMAIAATFLNPGVEVDSVNAFLPQAGQDIVNALASNGVVAKHAPGSLTIEGASVGEAPASAGGSLKPQEDVPPTPAAPTPAAPTPAAPSPFTVATTTADNSFDETTV